MSLAQLENQVVSKQRVTDHGEVYTSAREVNAMLDLVKQEMRKKCDSRYRVTSGNLLMAACVSSASRCV